jgi:peroxiredoxin-like protein
LLFQVKIKTDPLIIKRQKLHRRGSESVPRHHFHLNATWKGGRNGTGTIAAGNLQQQISIPKEMDGPGVGTNPDEMLIGAAATCYLITLAAIIERKQLPVTKLSLETEGIVKVENKFTFEKIIHRPHLLVKKEATEKEWEMIRHATEMAERSCMISNALRGNVELAVEAEFETCE